MSKQINTSDEPATKNCYWCHQAKPRTEFHRNRAQHDGLGTICKSCATLRQRERDAKRDHARWEERRRTVDPLREVKQAARYTLRYAVRSGKVAKLACERCGSGNSQAHHPDYSRPLEVLWLCPVHHAAEHAS